jgi:hypothetical protein
MGASYGNDGNASGHQVPATTAILAHGRLQLPARRSTTERVTSGGAATAQSPVGRMYLHRKRAHAQEDEAIQAQSTPPSADARQGTSRWR